MIRVKVIGLNNVIRKFLFYGSIVMIIYISLSLIFKLLNNGPKTFAVEMIEENINTNNVYAKNELDLGRIKNELGVEIVSIKSNEEKPLKVNEYTVNTDINNVNENTVNELENETNEVPSQYLESSSIKTWDRPKSYNVVENSSGKVLVGNTYITNYSKLKLNLTELSKVSKFPINDNTKILVFHTHTSEAYSEAGKESNFRTLNDGKNIVSVGNVLTENLLLKNFNAKHIKTKHDTPSYNGAYKASLKSVQDEFSKTKYDIVLDVHRDALSGNLNYRPTTEINGESAAKLMFVVGTNACGLSHDNWMENLKLALLIQNTANSMYPGLFRDLNLSKSRYNQHVCDGALIVEVGATGNTLDEVWTAMQYLANVIEALKE